MKGLLIVLTAIALVAALFLGGCAISGLLSHMARAMRDPTEVQYGGLYRTIAVMSAVGILLSGMLLAANVLILHGLFRGTTRRRRVVARCLAVFDIILAAAALGWLLWADTWRWAPWPWPWLAKAAAGLLAIKGVLVWRLVVNRTPAGAADTVKP